MPSFAELGNRLYSGETSVDFIGRRRTWYVIAVVMVLLSILAVGVRGLNPGIEFRGGSQFQVAGSTEELIGRDVVTEAGFPEPNVTLVGRDSVRIQTERLDSDQTDALRDDLVAAYDVEADDVTSSFVGPSWGQDISNQALQGLIIFLILVSIGLALYFRTWKMALAAMIALIHDLAITIGVYALVGFEVTPSTVIGFLTVLGYSLYDTVVVFDKVRENTQALEKEPTSSYAAAANLAVNQTVVRSVNTTIVALMPVAAVLFIGSFLLGAGTLRDITLALFVGTAVGAYSSIFLATPLLVQFREKEPAIHELDKRARHHAAARVRAAKNASTTVGGGTAGTSPSATVSAPGTATAVLDDVADGEPGPAKASYERTVESGYDPTERTGQRQQPKRPPRSKRGPKG